MAHQTYGALAAYAANSLNTLSVPHVQGFGTELRVDENPNVAPTTLNLNCTIHFSNFGKKSEIIVPSGTVVAVLKKHDCCRVYKNDVVHTLVLGAYPGAPLNPPPGEKITPDKLQAESVFVTVLVGDTIFKRKQVAAVAVAVEHVASVSTCHAMHPGGDGKLLASDKLAMLNIKRCNIGDTIHILYDGFRVYLAPHVYANERQRLQKITDFVVLRKMSIVEPYNAQMGIVRCDMKRIFGVDVRENAEVEEIVADAVEL